MSDNDFNTFFRFWESCASQDASGRMAPELPEDLCEKMLRLASAKLDPAGIKVLCRAIKDRPGFIAALADEIEKRRPEIESLVKARGIPKQTSQKTSFSIGKTQHTKEPKKIPLTSPHSILPDGGKPLDEKSC